MTKTILIGNWWDASNSNEVVSGTLEYEQNKGGVLTLVGAIGGMAIFTGQSEIQIIHGIANNKLITIYKGFTKSLTTSFPGPNSHVLIVNRFLIGAHLSLKDLIFDRVDLSTDFLPEFINHSSLVTTTYFEKNMKNIKGYGTKVDSQKPIKISTFSGGTASVKFGWNSKSDSFRNVTISERCFISLQFDSSHNMMDIIYEFIKPIQDLVTLGTDKANAINEIEFRSKSLVDDTDRQIGVIYHQKSPDIDIRKSNFSLMRHDMLFTLPELKGKRFKNWLEIHKKYSPVVAIIFGQRYTKSIPLEYQLLNMVSAAEGYHRRRFTRNTTISPSKWKSKKERITKNLSNKDAEFLNGILQYANEKRISLRMEEILKHSGLEGELVHNSKKWIRSILTYRNALTHYDPKYNLDNEKKTDNLIWLSVSLSWVLLACLMVDIGFTKSEVLDLFNQNERYKFDKYRRFKPF